MYINIKVSYRNIWRNCPVQRPLLMTLLNTTTLVQKWIKLFQNQGGQFFVTKFLINIYRGCRQGDPIPLAYLYCV